MPFVEPMMTQLTDVSRLEIVSNFNISTFTPLDLIHTYVKIIICIWIIEMPICTKPFMVPVPTYKVYLYLP